MKFADKPGFVVDSHSSRVHVAVHLKQPTRPRYGPYLKGSYLVLLRVGFTLPWNVATHAVSSYLTISTLPVPKYLGGIFSAALAVGSRRPDVIWHFALWSPDFPPLPK